MTQVTLPKAFKELFSHSRYKAYFGGRGGAKSHSFASALVIKGAEKPLRVLCCREIQRSIRDSSKRLIDDKIEDYGLQDFYTSTDTEIRGRNGTLFIFAGLKTNVEAIKSMEGLDVCWVEEADKVSQRSLELLIPTIRKEGSEIWFSWNPVSELDAVDMTFRGQNPPPDSIIRHVNYDDNPFFPDVLLKEAEFMKETEPEKYNHIWLGGYRTISEGAYYAKSIAKAANEGRIRKVLHDPSAPVYVAFDLGISDSTSLWFFQVIAGEWRFLEYFESNGQGIEFYAKELQTRGYNYSPLILPHDARARQLGTGKSIEEVLRGYGYQTVICPQIHVKDGIEAARRVIDKAYFDTDGCAEGLRFLREYRENYDDKMRISRGPLHDYTSHAADSLRYAAVGMNEHPKALQDPLQVYYAEVKRRSTKSA